MKKLILVLLALFLVGGVCSNEVYAQKKKDKKENVKAGVVPPKFKGKSFISWLYYQIDTKWTTHRDYKGQALITFTVGPDGKVCDFLLKKGTGIVEIDNMIRDIVVSSPKWKPKKVNGEPVAHTFTLPVHFSGNEGVYQSQKFSLPQNAGRTNPAAQNVRGWQR